MSDIIERAFQLASSGECRNMQDLKKRLIREHYFSVEQHLAGVSIRKQLTAIFAERRQRRPEADLAK